MLELHGDEQFVHQSVEIVKWLEQNHATMEGLDVLLTVLARNLVIFVQAALTHRQLFVSLIVETESNSDLRPVTMEVTALAMVVAQLVL